MVRLDTVEPVLEFGLHRNATFRGDAETLCNPMTNLVYTAEKVAGSFNSSATDDPTGVSLARFRAGDGDITVSRIDFDGTGSHVHRFLAAMGDVTIREASFERSSSQTGAVETLDWDRSRHVPLRNEAGDDAVRRVRVDEFSGKALTAGGFQDVQLRLDRHGAQTLPVEGARWACVLAGLGDDAIAITIGAQGHCGAQVHVDGGAGDDVIDLPFAPAASTALIASARQTVKGGAGDDVIIGRGGTVVALCDGLREDFSITRAPDGRFVVVDLNPIDGDEGTDLLAGVSRLQFADPLLRLDDIRWP